MNWNKLLCIFIMLKVNKVMPAEVEYETILQMVPDWPNTNLTQENRDLMLQKLKNEMKLIDNVAYRGDKKKDYRITLRELNLETRKNYAEIINHVGYNIFPLLIATDVDHDKRLSGVGSELILFLRNGSIYTSKPTPAVYEINKDLAHMFIGIFSIISPFFRNPTSPMWHDKLRNYQKYIQNSLTFFRSPIPEPLSLSSHCDNNLSNEDQETMLTMFNDYIDDCFKRQSVDYLEYTRFCNQTRPYIYKALICAAQVQIISLMQQLQIWKDQLGDEWDDLYVVIPVIWPVARINPRKQIIEHFMKEERRLTNIIMAEGAKSIQEAREILGRVVADRTMSELVFSHHTKPNIQQNIALSTRTDMVSPTTEDIMHKMNITDMYIRLSVHENPNDLRFDDYYQIPVV